MINCVFENNPPRIMLALLRDASMAPVLDELSEASWIARRGRQAQPDLRDESWRPQLGFVRSGSL